MRAARWHAPYDVRIESVDVPEAVPGEVVLRVEWCGICGSDLHEFTHGPVIIPSRPHPLTGRLPPITLGHEFCGTVVSAGAGALFDAGRRVTANACLVCHACSWCRAGQFNLCAKLGSIGLCADGGLAEYVRVPAYVLHRVPDGLAPDLAALAEPLSVAVHACRRSRLRSGETVAVIGAGTIGLLVLQAACAAGAAAAFSIEPLIARRRLAVELGARAAWDPGDPVDREIAAATDGRRADVVFECSGSLAGIETALRVSGKGGRVVIVGIYRGASSAPWARLQAHEKEIIGSSAYTNEFPTALELLASGAVQSAPLITDRIALEDVEARGLRALLDAPQDHLKILVHP